MQHSYGCASWDTPRDLIDTPLTGKRQTEMAQAHVSPRTHLFQFQTEKYEVFAPTSQHRLLVINDCYMQHVLLVNAQVQAESLKVRGGEELTR